MASALVKATRKVGRLGKDAFKFRFTVTFESIELTLTDRKAWQPTTLSVRWYRGARVVQSDPPHVKESAKPGNELQAVWRPEAEESLLVTLYKDVKSVTFEEKTYKFQIENQDRDGKTKILAVFQMDMAEYAPETVTKDITRHSLSMAFKVKSIKIKSATLSVEMRCEFMKQGKAGDEDMMSTFSAVQMDNVHDFEEEEAEDDVVVGSSPPPPQSKAEGKHKDSPLVKPDGDKPKEGKGRVEEWIEKAVVAPIVDPVPVKLEPKDVMESLFLSAHFRDSTGKLSVGHPHLRDTALIGLYFSGKWCPPCQIFIPKLKTFYETVRKGGGSFDILYVSSDQSAEEMKRYTEEMKMPWFSIDFEDCTCDQLRQTYKIADLPVLLVVDSQGKILENDGKALVEVATSDNVELAVYERLKKSAAPTFSGQTYPQHQPRSPSPKSSKDISSDEKPEAEASDEVSKKTFGSAVKSFFSKSKKGTQTPPASPKTPRVEEKQETVEKSEEEPKQAETVAKAVEPPEAANTERNPEQSDVKSPTKKGIAGSVLQLLKGPKKDKDKKKRVFPKETSSPEGATTSPGQEAKTSDEAVSQGKHHGGEKTAKKERIKQLEAENAKLKREVVELREDVEELQVLVEQLRGKLDETEAKASQERDFVEARLTLKGWLMKRGIKGPTATVWRRRWFALDSSGSQLQYFKGSKANATPQGFIDMAAVEGVEEQAVDRQDKNNSSFVVITAGRTYELLAHDESMMRKWIQALETVRNSTRGKKV
ncbi:uncharacterized protein [Oscarella lobularis]|uniref:uncharacterized protein isoform X2 n=1 Tax=Oscarella lobularis TaxID=121494 RepID=UPI003314449E